MLPWHGPVRNGGCTLNQAASFERTGRNIAESAAGGTIDAGTPAENPQRQDIPLELTALGPTPDPKVMICKSYILQSTSLRTFSSVTRRGELPNARKLACLVIDKQILHKYGLDKHDGLGSIIRFQRLPMKTESTRCLLFPCFSGSS